MKAFLSTFFVLTIVFLSPNSYAATGSEELKSYVRELIDESYTTFNDRTLSAKEKEEKIWAV